LTPTAICTAALTTSPQDSCDAKAETPCAHLPLSATPCDDGSVCTVDDVCVSGTCTGSKKTCDEGTACTVDSCHPTKGCIYTTILGSCDDGDACTKGDACLGKACVGVKVTCDDGNACTKSDACANGTCQGTPMSADLRRAVRARGRRFGLVLGLRRRRR
jgi:hypothetical protein